MPHHLLLEKLISVRIKARNCPSKSVDSNMTEVSGRSNHRYNEVLNKAVCKTNAVISYGEQTMFLIIRYLIFGTELKGMSVNNC